MTRRLAALAVIGWLALGLGGLWLYLHNYSLYRGFPPPTEAAGVRAGRVVRVRFYSRALHRTDSYVVYLPPGYAREAAAGRRFPVLYLLHGDLVRAMSFVNIGDVAVFSDRLLAEHRIRPMLVVMPEGEDGTRLSDTEWANTPHGRYESYVLDAVHAADRRWATLRRRDARAIAGLSMGAYGAVNVGLHHLRTFGTIESWSGYFLQTPTGPFRHLGATTLAANSPDDYVAGLTDELHRLPLHALLYGGTRDHYIRQIGPFAARLRTAGAAVHTIRFPGEGHHWRLWRSETPRSLRYASRWLSHASRERHGRAGRHRLRSRARPRGAR